METFACPHSLTEAHSDDIDLGEICLLELLSVFWDSLEGGDINLKMITMGAKFGSFAERRALLNPVCFSTPGILLPRRAGTKCLAADEPCKSFAALLCHCRLGDSCYLLCSKEFFR